MKKAQLFLILLLIIFSSVTLAGCTAAADGEQVYFYERPAVGFTVEDEVITNVNIETQSSLNIKAQDGIVKVTKWDRDSLQIVEKRKLKGPSTRKALKVILGDNNLKVDSSSYDIKLVKEPDKELKPFFRRTVDIEIMVPDSIKTIDIEAKSGMISMSGIDELSIVHLTLGKGNIKVDNCKANKIYATITDGDLDLAEINSSGTYKCDRGDIKLQGITGDIELKLNSGDTYIKNAEGILNCDISTGSIIVEASHLKAESMLYASYGDIDTDLEGIEASGKYTFNASQGKIQLNMPKKTGWSLLARSTKGAIYNKLNLAANELEKAPSGEVYGDVRGGGPSINVYVDRGDIYLH